MSAPPAAITRPPQSELVDAVRHWVHFDNLAETLTKQVTNARGMRASFEERVLKLLETTGMRNAVLQINGATLQRQGRFKTTDLSWGFLEEQMHEYYKSRGRPDETSEFLDFIQKRRGGKTVEYLKKTSTSTSTATTTTTTSKSV